jgi:heme/copper-type cytochrome/quinol oxidase subunit 2
MSPVAVDERARMLLAIIDDIVMLALAIAVAAVLLIALLVALYVWALRKQREGSERTQTCPGEDGGPDPDEGGPGKAR